MAVKKSSDGYTPYAAGKKMYGGGRSAPNIGPSDPIGYRERDRKKAVQEAAKRRLAGN